MAKSSDPIVILPGAPVVVEGSNLDEVYGRACAAAETDAARGTLIVHLNLPKKRTTVCRCLRPILFQSL
jgi:hypothetical protein